MKGCVLVCRQKTHERPKSEDSRDLIWSLPVKEQQHYDNVIEVKRRVNSPTSHKGESRHPWAMDS